ncbi:unnamed protein product [Brassica oleracea]
MSGGACDFINWNREPYGSSVSFGGGLLQRRVGVGYAGGVDASFSCHHFEPSDWFAAASCLETWLLGFILVQCRHRYGYKYGGFHPEPATSEMTRKVSASEAIRRISSSSYSRRWQRTVSSKTG